MPKIAYTKAEIGEYFKVHYMTISRTVKNYEESECWNVRSDSATLHDLLINLKKRKKSNE